MNNPSSLREAKQESPRLQAGVLFVDLDLTLLRENIACYASDEELINAPLNQDVVALIENARAAGIPVVMATRNDLAQINRVVGLRPDIRVLFDEMLACVSGGKSEKMREYLASHNIPPEQAVFLDDTRGELEEVQRNLEGIRVGEPNESVGIQIEKAEAEVVSITTRQKTAEALSLMHANQVLLAA